MIQVDCSEVREYCRNCGCRFGTGDGPQYCARCEPRGQRWDGDMSGPTGPDEVLVPVQGGEGKRLLARLPCQVRDVYRVWKPFRYVPPKFLLLSAAGWRV